MSVLTRCKVWLASGVVVACTVDNLVRRAKESSGPNTCTTAEPCVAGATRAELTNEPVRDGGPRTTTSSDEEEQKIEYSRQPRTSTLWHGQVRELERVKATDATRFSEPRRVVYASSDSVLQYC